MSTVIETGKTVEEALEKALVALGRSVDEVDYEVLEQPSRGFFGLFGGRMAVAGGINGSITLGKGSAREIRAAVCDALSVFGRAGGFILSPVDALFPDTQWQNVRIMIEAWKECR